jgi:hypothetical protein
LFGRTAGKRPARLFVSFPEIPSCFADVISVLNRRSHYRAPEYHNAVLSLPDSDEGPAECRVIERSPGGMKVLVARHLPAGSTVEVLMDGQAIAGEVRYSATRPMGFCEIGIRTRA